MPRGRPRKNPLSEQEIAARMEAVAVEAAVPAVVAEPDPMEVFREAFGKAIKADPKAVEKALTDILGVQAATPRTVTENRPRKVEVPKAQLIPEAPEPPPPPPKGVVFVSPHMGYRQVIRPSQKKFYGDGNVDIIPPTVVEFEMGTKRLTEPQDIADMRKKIAKQKSIGAKPQVIELRDEIAEHIAAGTTVTPVSSQNVTVHTPLADLVQ